MYRCFGSAVCALIAIAFSTAAVADRRFEVQTQPGLQAPAQLVTDANGITHVVAVNEADLYFLQGWVHARDRFFQMDQNRRIANGTSAELLGTAALPSDVQLRTIGLRRAAQRSLAALSLVTRSSIAAYTRGVNAWLAANPLPPEYGALELSRTDPWTDTDSVVVAKLIAFSLSFGLDTDATIALQSYVAAGQALGFDGQALFAEDLNRAAPFDGAATVPDASVPRAHAGHRPGRHEHRDIDPKALEQAREWGDKLRGIPLFQRILDRDQRDGSNLWAVSARLSASGRPMIANDPHLALGTPSTFYPMGLTAFGRVEVFGSGFPGIPGVVQGYNRHIAWGTTNNAVDVTDTFQEQVVPDPASPSGLSTLYLGRLEHVIPIPEVFRANQPGNGIANDVIVVPPGGAIPPVTLIVPRRNNGPIVSLNQATGSALSVQYAGFSATRELDSFFLINRARGLDQFKAALQAFDFGSQNFVYADDRGNIAYFTTGEMPLREDLQAGRVSGLPPWFIRNGQGGNEWIAQPNRPSDQALAYAVLPFDELPQIINPPAGWFVNANNDPAGLTLDNDPLNKLRPDGGILYLAYGWDRGFRAGRITDRIRGELAQRGRVSFDAMQSIQADVKLRDAQYFAPWIVNALARARAPGANPILGALGADAATAEAVARLAAWDYSTPTGLAEGWDAGKPAGVPPTAAQIQNSVAATIYATWRARVIANTVDAALRPSGLPVPGSQEVVNALRHLLDSFEARGGVGASGINFFNVPGVSNAADRRDVVLLRSLRESLTLLASDEFKPAFANSTQQLDYRWGKLHRIVFAHPLGGPFSVPPAGGVFPPPLAGLAGIPTDGGFSTVDASSHSPRAASLNAFMFSSGPVRRFVGEVGPGRTRAESIWAGGTSGVLGDPNYTLFLPKWLANETVPLALGIGQSLRGAQRVVLLRPAH
jgi:penicillin G amidase